MFLNGPEDVVFTISLLLKNGSLTGGVFPDLASNQCWISCVSCEFETERSLYIAGMSFPFFSAILSDVQSAGLHLASRQIESERNPDN